MIISRDAENKKIKFEVNNEILKQVNRFLYLGTEMREDVQTDKEIKCRIDIFLKINPIPKVLTTKRKKLKS